MSQSHSIIYIKISHSSPKNLKCYSLKLAIFHNMNKDHYSSTFVLRSNGTHRGFPLLCKLSILWDLIIFSNRYICSSAPGAACPLWIHSTPYKILYSIRTHRKAPSGEKVKSANFIQLNYFLAKARSLLLCHLKPTFLLLLHYFSVTVVSKLKFFLNHIVNHLRLLVRRGVI